MASCECTNVNAGNFLTNLGSMDFSRRILLHWVSQ